MRRSKLSNRITWRLTLIRVVFGTLLIGSVFLFDMAVSIVESKERAQYIMAGIDDKLTTMVSVVEITAANNVAEFEDNLDDPEEVYKAMEQELQFNNRYLGCGLGFEPDYYPSEGRWFEPYVRLVDSTHVEREQIGSAQHDYHGQEWYLKGLGLERSKGYLTDPYFDDAGGKRLLSTYVTPVFDRQGRRVGVYGIDLNLSWIEQTVANEENDFFIRDEKLFFCIGDVSGKGVPASLVMAVSRALFRNVAVHTAEPSHIVQAMNNAISDSNDNNMFVTLFIGVLDLHTGHLRYCNAAHNTPYIQDAPLPCDPNLPIGVMPDWKFTEQETDMQPGSILFLYTDGLTEAENDQQAQFGDKRVSDVVSSFEGSPEEMIETMTGAVRQFVGDTEQSDDLTMLAIKYRNMTVRACCG